MSWQAPRSLEPRDDLSAFDSGEPVLDEWLRKHALANQYSGASRTFVVCDATGSVQGFYTLAAGAVAHITANASIRRNMPEPIPVLVLGRLAVGRSMQGSGLGKELLRDAVIRAMQVGNNAGVRALLLHALHERAAQFYLRNGFTRSPFEPLTLMLKLSAIPRVHDPQADYG